MGKRKAMTKEEIKVGDHVWVSRVIFSDHGTMTLGLFAELEKEEKADRFLVVKVENGTTLKEGRSVCATYWSSPFGYSDLHKTRKDALESWNRNIYNTIDRLTSTYEQTMKRVKKKIMSE
jgi:hypothetical protein